MDDFLERTKLLLKDNYKKVKKAKIFVIGIGGVGSYVAESLVRTGVENITIVDHKKVDITNINRQTQALHSTIGTLKTKALKKRLLDINPRLNIETINEFDLKKTLTKLKNIDFVVDAIDTITYKLKIIEFCCKFNINFISCMGAALKTDLTKLHITTINQTHTDTVAKVIRYEAKKRSIPLTFKVVWSSENVDSVLRTRIELDTKPQPLPSTIFVPAAMGLLAASYVIKSISV